MDWDDVVHDDLRPLWESNFQLMKEIGNLQFKQAAVPEDTVDLNNTLNVRDASHSMVGSCIYVTVNCQLVFARTKTVPKGMSQPKAELFSALINAYSGDIDRGSFGKYH